MRSSQGERGVAVFDWVVVDVIHTALEVLFATHELFPITTLPDTAFVLAFAALGSSLTPGQAA